MRKQFGLTQVDLAATGCRLHLIRPLGFDISEKAVRRAGLDYWHMVDVLDYERSYSFSASALASAIAFSCAAGGQSS